MPITKPVKNAASYKAKKVESEVDNEDAVDPRDFSEDAENRTAKIGTTIQQGWDSATALLEKETPFEERDFKLSEDKQLIKFLQDSPFATYEQHWINDAKGKKSFICIGDDCPLCDILGDKPRGKFLFNVLALSEEEPKVQVLTAPPSLFRLIKDAHEDERHGPLDKEYYEISRSGTGPKTQYKLALMKSRDLEEEWNIKLSDAKNLEGEAVLFTVSEIVKETPRSELLDLARLLSK